MDDIANIISEQTQNQMNIINNDIEDDEYNRVYFIAKNNYKNINNNSQIKNNTVLNNTFETIKMGKKRGRKSSLNKNRIQRERADDLEIIIFNNFFKMICYLISILTSRLGEDYKINKINKKSEDTDSQKKRKIFYEKKFGYILCKSLPRNMKKDIKEKIEEEDNPHNKNIYDKLVKDGK